MPRSSRSSSFSDVHHRVSQKWSHTYHQFRSKFSYTRSRQRIMHLEASVLLLQQQIGDLVEDTHKHQTTHQALQDKIVQVEQCNLQLTTDVKQLQQQLDCPPTQHILRHKRPRVLLPENNKTPANDQPSPTLSISSPEEDDIVKVQETPSSASPNTDGFSLSQEDGDEERKKWFTLRYKKKQPTPIDTLLL